MSQAKIDGLQRVQNVLTRVVVEARGLVGPIQRTSVASYIGCHRITYTLCIITWKALHTTRSPYELPLPLIPAFFLHQPSARPSGINRL